MSTMNRTDATELSPKKRGLFFSRRLQELSGAILVSIGFFLAVALLTYTSSDPSLNSVGLSSASNLVGLPGAIVSDLLLQSADFGFVLLFCLWRVL